MFRVTPHTQEADHRHGHDRRPEGVLRKPSWLRVPFPNGDGFERVRAILRGTRLTTVCTHARCPNVSECWASGTATVMLMGDVCTRACRFCNVESGHPQPLDQQEPEHLAQAVRDLGLRYVVITSVDRDDLWDGGASHLAQAIEAVRNVSPATQVEILIPDFRGNQTHLDTVGKAAPHAVGHNIETVARLQSTVRDSRAGYEQSLNVLEHMKSTFGLYTKSSILVGLGESEDELRECLRDLRRVGVDMVTLGQYLQPSPRHLKVKRYYAPDEFNRIRLWAMETGFTFVAAGPLVRSSYRASEFLGALPSGTVAATSRVGLTDTERPGQL